MREQIAQQPPRRRASLPPEERTASWHHVGTRSGMHPEDTPYLTTTRSRSHAPTTEHSIAVDEEEEFVSQPTARVGTSAKRYDLAPYERRERRTEAFPRQGKHPIFYSGLFLLILVVFLSAYTFIPPALQQWHDESTYGYPRTFQTDANVGHGGMEHFIVLNNHGTIEVLEIPSYPSPTNQTRLYLIVRLSSQGADLVPATLSFPDVNGDGKPDMQVTVLDGANPSVWILFISTDQAAYIPPASNTTPPTFGQVTVAAHAVQPGAQGNILPYDLNGSCCTTSILVKNTSAFTGGQNARDYTVVTGRDIINGSTSLKTALLKSEQGALNAQIIPSEALITPPCNPTGSSNQKVGDEAKQVTVMVSEICSGIAYDARTLHANDTQVITKIARQRFGTGYTLLGDVTDSVVHATISDPKRGIATFTVKIDATSIYQLSPSEKQHLVNMIAGKSKTTAIHILLSVPGIQAASIRFTRGDTLPQDPQAIRILVLYQAM